MTCNKLHPAETIFTAAVSIPAPIEGSLDKFFSSATAEEEILSGDELRKKAFTYSVDGNKTNFIFLYNYLKTRNPQRVESVIKVLGNSSSPHTIMSLLGLIYKDNPLDLIQIVKEGKTTFNPTSKNWLMLSLPFVLPPNQIAEIVEEQIKNPDSTKNNLDSENLRVLLSLYCFLALSSEQVRKKFLLLLENFPDKKKEYLIARVLVENDFPIPKELALNAHFFTELRNNLRSESCAVVNLIEDPTLRKRLLNSFFLRENRRNPQTFILLNKNQESFDYSVEANQQILKDSLQNLSLIPPTAAWQNIVRDLQLPENKEFKREMVEYCWQQMPRATGELLAAYRYRFFDLLNQADYSSQELIERYNKADRWANQEKCIIQGAIAAAFAREGQKELAQAHYNSFIDEMAKSDYYSPLTASIIKDLVARYNFKADFFSPDVVDRRKYEEYIPCLISGQDLKPVIKVILSQRVGLNDYAFWHKVVPYLAETPELLDPIVERLIPHNEGLLKAFNHRDCDQWLKSPVAKEKIAAKILALYLQNPDNLKNSLLNKVFYQAANLGQIKEFGIYAQKFYNNFHFDEKFPRRGEEAFELLKDFQLRLQKEKKIQKNAS